MTCRTVVGLFWNNRSGYSIGSMNPSWVTRMNILLVYLFFSNTFDFKVLLIAISEPQNKLLYLVLYSSILLPHTFGAFAKAR
jgi:hypothetical protein